MSLVRTVGLVGQLVNIYLQLVASCLDYFSCIFLNTTEICPISSRPQYKESDFCPVTIMHFHHHEFSRSVDPPLSVLSNPQKVSAVLPVRSFPPGPHQQRASLRFDSFFSECSPAPLEFVVGDRRRSSQDHGGQN